MKKYIKFRRKVTTTYYTVFSKTPAHSTNTDAYFCNSTRFNQGKLQAKSKICFQLCALDRTVATPCVQRRITVPFSTYRCHAEAACRQTTPRWRSMIYTSSSLPSQWFVFPVYKHWFMAHSSERACRCLFLVHWLYVSQSVSQPV